MTEKEDISKGQPTDDEIKDAEADRRKARNMFIMVATTSLTLLGVGVFSTAYQQWIYTRFQVDALGDLFYQMNTSTATNPCFRGNQTTSSHLAAKLIEAQANSAHFGVLFSVCAMIPSFFVNLFLGVYGDRIGRRIIFIVPLGGNFVRVAIVCAVAYWNLPVNVILIGSLVAGFTGDSAAYSMAMFVYTADNTASGKNRSFLMIVTQAVMLLCATLSGLATGYFIEATGYVWPMFVGLLMLAVSMVITVFLIEETLDTSNVEKKPFWEGLKGIFSFYFERPIDPIYRRKDYIILGLVFFTFASSLGAAIFTVFIMGEPFCWGARQQGIVNSVNGLGHAILSTLLMRVLQIFISDELMVIISMLSSVANRFIMAFAENSTHIYIAFAAGILEVSVLAIIRSILSKMVSEDNRGSLFASLAVIETATIAASGAGLSALYSSTVAYWRGLTHFAVGCLTLLSAVFMGIYKLMIMRRELPSLPDKELESPVTDYSDKESDASFISNNERKVNPFKENQD
ncbi:solute carrier family 46 member 3-like [Elysia marginata]|uniref:Lysosomal proton-coupled steroid conjugate and bile acid symporter SLC46A3 n=1 Tax=Elysia marginata TaxID=1093978 RepID=A0AAV4GFM9_9GAST|nr:solute carrier family 46 member 3-like [Elysia marginata]